MRTLITGGSGLIGSRIAEILLSDGEEVILLDVEPDADLAARLHGTHDSRVEVVAADIRDLPALRRTMKAARPDAVVHLASLLSSSCQRDPRLATEINLMGSINVFELATELGINRVVCASSITVYGADSDYPATELPLRESAALQVASGVRIYGAGKVYLEALAEAYSRDEGPLIVGLRPSIVYGGIPKNASVDWIRAAVESASQGRLTRIGNGEAVLSLVHLDDVADQFVVLLRAHRSALGEIRFFNSGGDTCSINEFAAVLAALCPRADIHVDPGVAGGLMGIASSIDGSTIDALQARPRRHTPLSAGLARYLCDIREATTPPK